MRPADGTRQILRLVVTKHNGSKLLKGALLRHFHAQIA